MTAGAGDVTPSKVELYVVSVDSERARRLERSQIAEMAERYGGSGPAPLRGEEFEPPKGCFVVATIDGTDVACGGLRPWRRGVAEIKRMYVAPEFRRRGIGARVLAFLEERAGAEGYAETWLETGIAQPDAISLYVAAGYRPTAPYGEFKDDPRNRSFFRLLAE
jgi:GNAT superfamily N-acetyltransferase